MDSEGEELGPLAPMDMAQWLRREIREISKASELRIHDAIDFVIGYLTGQLSQQQMEEWFSIYSRRWGDALYGVNLDDKMTNDEILRRLDRATSAKESVEHPIVEHQEKVRQRGGGRKHER